MSPYKVAFITGAGAGIGKALALELASKGWAIAAVDVREAGLVTLAAELHAQNRRCAWRVADVTMAAALKNQALELERELGPIDLLIANAGIGSETSALNLDPVEFTRIISVNLLGVANSVAAVLPGMLQRRAGHLVAISSVASYRGLPRMLAYCASKSGVNALMEGIRAEVLGHGISTTTICPAWIRTAMTTQIDLPMENLLEPEEAARRIVRAIEKRLPFYAFPARMAWRLRILRCLPITWQDKIIRKTMRMKGPKTAGN